MAILISVNLGLIIPYCKLDMPIRSIHFHILRFGIPHKRDWKLN